MAKSPLGDRGLHSRVVSTLGQRIVDGELPAGAILSVDRLGEEFAVSRSVLREALRVLQSLGMVEPRQRVGTQVLPRADWDVSSPQVVEWRGRGADYFVQMRELLEMRLGIEPVAARLAATAMTPGEADRVQECAAAMVDASAAGDDRRYLEADVAFHTTILAASGNLVIAHFASTVEALLRTRTEERRHTITEYTPSSAHRHNELARTLVDRDPAAAERWARELLGETLAEFIAEGAQRTR